MTCSPDISIQPYYSDGTVTIYNGDCLEVLPVLNGITAIVTDPPYGLDFMGKDWDHGSPGQTFWKVIAASCLPGAPLLSFGGTRTYHRLVSAIEDAGWEIRDCLMWIYGSGFPKSLDVGKAIDKAAGAEREIVGRVPRSYPDSDRWGDPLQSRAGGANNPTSYAGSPHDDLPGKIVTAPATPAAQLWDGYGTALKPAYEPVVLARKPLEGTVAYNVQKYGTGALWIDGSRIPGEYETRDRKTDGGNSMFGLGEGGGAFVPTEGRWPTNVIHDGSGEVVELFPTSSSKSGEPRTGKNGEGWGMTNTCAEYDDSGSAARFFYTAKASTFERNAGLEGDNPRNRGVHDRLNNHPTVKPLALMRYLITLITQPQRNLILDPFMGSGTTLRAAKDLGLKAIGIEVDERYCQIAVERLSQMTMSFEGDIE